MHLNQSTIVRQNTFPSQVIGVTLVDISSTGVTRGEGKQRNQHRNWETTLQIFSLLTQPIVTQPPICVDACSPEIKDGPLWKRYGKFFQFQASMLLPKCNMWIFQICSENTEVFGPDLDNLRNSFDMIPVITGLDETVTIQPASFNTKNKELINIQFFDSSLGILK